MADAPLRQVPTDLVVAADPPQESLINRIARSYTDCAPLRAVVQGIPGVGGSLDTLLAWQGQRFIEARHADVLERLGRRLQTVEERAIDRGIFETEEGFDIFRRMLESAGRARDEERREAIAQIVCGVVTHTFQGVIEPEGVLAMLGDLTSNEWAFAVALWAQWKSKTIWLSSRLPSGLREDQAEFLAQRLRGHGLLVEHTHGGGSDSEEGNAIETRLYFSAIGVALMEFLHDSRGVKASSASSANR